MPLFLRPRAGVWPVILLLALAPQAHAHLVVDGAGEVVNGALHPFISPGQVLLFLGLGLLLGRRLPFEMGMPLKVFAPVSAVALLSTLWLPMGEVYPPVMVVLAMGISVLVALDRRWPAMVYGIACALAAVGIGLDSGVEQGSLFEKLKTLSGTWVAVNAAVFYIAACASHAEGRQWAVTAIRIAAAWTIAISMMMLAFFVKKGA